LEGWGNKTKRRKGGRCGIKGLVRGLSWKPGVKKSIEGTGTSHNPKPKVGRSATNETGGWGGGHGVCVARGKKRGWDSKGDHKASRLRAASMGEVLRGVRLKKVIRRGVLTAALGVGGGCFGQKRGVQNTFVKKCMEKSAARMGTGKGASMGLKRGGGKWGGKKKKVRG